MHWNFLFFAERRKRNGIGSETGTIRAQSPTFKALINKTCKSPRFKGKP